MITANKAVELLWKKGYFRPPNYRSTKDVETKASNDYGCTYSNWNILLSRISFLRKKNGCWIQKIEAEKDDEITIVLIEKGKPREATKTFEEIVKGFTGHLSISDPYLTEDAMYLLEKIPSKNIKFLFHKTQNKLSQREIDDFKKANPHIKLKKYPDDHLHDRYILSDDKILIIGHGLSLRNKETFIIELKDKLAKDLRLGLIQVFDRRWKISTDI